MLFQNDVSQTRYLTLIGGNAELFFCSFSSVLVAPDIWAAVVCVSTYYTTHAAAYYQILLQPATAISGSARKEKKNRVPVFSFFATIFEYLAYCSPTNLHGQSSSEESFKILRAFSENSFV